MTIQEGAPSIDGELNKLTVNRLDYLMNVVDADATTPFVGHQTELIKQGDLVTGKREVETGVIYDLRILRKLKAKGKFSLRNDLERLGAVDLADKIIFGGNLLDSRHA